MPVEAFDPARPEFSPDLPKKIRGGQRVEAYQDEDIASLPGEDPNTDAPGQRIVIAGAARGKVTQLRANPMDKKFPRSENVQTPPPLAKPFEKRSVPHIPDELEEISASLPKVDLGSSGGEVPEAREEKTAAASPFSTSTTTPAAFDRMLIEKYGIEWLQWIPETLWQTIRMDYRTKISRPNQDKISAVVLLHVSDSFWKHWETFEKVVLAFNNVLPHFDRHQEVSSGQMLHAVLQANEIRKEAFEPEVLSYIAVRAREEGLLWLPSPIDVAQARLDQLNPPEVSVIKKEVRERWDAFQDADLKDVEFQEDVYGVHLAKLAAIDLYLKGMISGLPEEP